MTTKALLTMMVILLSATLASGDTSGSQSIDAFPDWLKTVGIFSGLTSGPGVLVWYLWYNTTKVIPRMEKRHEDRIALTEERHSAQMKALEERHAQHWALLNSNSRQDLQDLTKGWRDDHVLLRNSLDKHSDAIDRLSIAVSEKEDCKYVNRSQG